MYTKYKNQVLCQIHWKCAPIWRFWVDPVFLICFITKVCYSGQSQLLLFISQLLYYELQFGIVYYSY